MPKVVIIKPNNSREQTQIVLRNLASVMERIIKMEFNITVKIEITKTGSLENTAYL